MAADNFVTKLYNNYTNAVRFPKPRRICEWTDNLISLLFPELCECEFANEEELGAKFQELKDDLLSILSCMQVELPAKEQEIVISFFENLEGLHQRMLEDVEAINQGDPAAKNTLEVVLTYPGFYAIAFYRVAHEFYKMGIPLLPRIITEFASSRTGIEIHPGAKIGRHFCIDHGAGVVIGETCIIGENVKVYQGVTLGALSVAKEMADMKRHPTIHDNVVIYAGATILGGETEVGANSIIGGNVWLTKTVPANSVVYHKSEVKVRNQEPVEKEI